MNYKKRASLKTLILLPVFILGALTIICNVMAINNIRTVNSNAADITDNCMMSVSDLGEIKNDIQVIHTLGLSHIIATDLNTMISVVGEINDNQEELEKKLDEYKKYVQNDDMDTYNSLVSNYNTMKYELGNIMAYSALGKNEEAYAIANGVVSDSSTAIQKDIEVLSTHANDTASEARERLTSVYVSSLVSNGIVIIISVILIIVAIYCVMKYVIKPIIATNKDIRDIIDGIDNGEGDLTKRVRVISNDEIADLGNGINLFMDKLLKYHSVDIQWGNHDVVWMGAAAGQLGCIANVIRICARYGNLDIIEDGYGISLLPLATFAMRMYKDDPCTCFKLKGTDRPESDEMQMNLRIHKAISIIQFKVEGQIIERQKGFH